MRVVVQALLFSNNGTDKLRRSSERIPIHPPNPSTNTARSIHPSSTSTAASSKPPIPKTTVQDLSNGSERTGGATPTRSEDLEGAVLPGRPVTADSRPRQGTPKGPIRRPHATPVEKPAEKSVPAQRKSRQGTRRNPSEISTAPVEISLRSPSDWQEETIRTRGAVLKPHLNFRRSEDRTTGQNASSSSPPQHHRSDRTTDHRISPNPRTSVSSRQPTTSRGTYQSPPKESQQGPQTRSPTSGIRDQSSDMEVTRKNLPPNITSPQAVPSLGIAAAVQRRMAGRNETRRKDGYSGMTQVIHHQCSNKSRVRKTYELKLNL
ncbi:hypothetical protein BTUL_0067g00050 [Botrytis tulipae]|uniref:Uncharacterized protein n=1 Tax=Botrytis tulipae TaxID=87230 RepID=A0A4Z1ESW6_9HELO|nr:hypothetical protein BTUL_0067g00050 [Botrytis tulipae]